MSFTFLILALKHQLISMLITFRVEKRRNILITSLRFFRLVSEYFDKTGEVFDSLVMGSDINDFNNASLKLNELLENQLYLGKIFFSIKINTIQQYLTPV